MNEFKLIEKYLKPLSYKNSSALNLRDDIFFDKNNRLAVSVDTYVQGVHFIGVNPKYFIKKVLRASLSDMYCKGIKPKTYFLSFASNNKITNSFSLNKIKKILFKEQKKFNIFLGGGDTTNSSKLVITIVVLGYSKKKPVLRKGSSIDDDIYVTGNIGDSYIGLNILKNKMNFGKYNKFFIKKYYEPDLPVKFSPFLNKIASSSIDISDGLAQDLEHLCVNSNCGAQINLESIPFSSSCQRLLDKKKIKIDNIFSKGDDYQILFTSKPKNRSKIIQISKKINTKISKIGVMTRNKNIHFKRYDQRINLSAKNKGYTHKF